MKTIKQYVLNCDNVITSHKWVILYRSYGVTDNNNAYCNYVENYIGCKSEI